MVHSILSRLGRRNIPIDWTYQTIHISTLGSITPAAAIIHVIGANGVNICDDILIHMPGIHFTAGWICGPRLPVRSWGSYWQLAAYKSCVLPTEPSGPKRITRSL